MNNNNYCDSEEFIDSFSEKELQDFEYYISELIENVLDSEITCMSKPNYIKIFVEKIMDCFYNDWIENAVCREDDYENIYEYVEDLLLQFLETVKPELPLRQENSSDITNYNEGKSNTQIANISNKITELQSRYQPAQRTTEWYEYRNSLITASNLYKALGTQSQINSLILEKNKPFIPYKMNYFSKNPRQWGTLYEPISVMLYEKQYNTKVSDFGCIQHSNYSYIGASPDGINTDPLSDRYGRMIEVKNIVNREITDSPKEEYWIQMQIQMETCDLDECDFIETRFKEFETEEDFYNNTVSSDDPDYNISEKQKGVYLCFVERISHTTDPIVSTDSVDLDTNIKTIIMDTTTNVQDESPPKYVYMPLDIPCNIESVNAWIQQQKQEMKPNYVLYSTCYWYLDEFSCILVKRNRLWFQTVLPKILDTWNLITASKNP